jgi:hypothetical protein
MTAEAPPRVGTPDLVRLVAMAKKYRCEIRPPKPRGCPRPEIYSFRASFAFGRSSLLPHLRHRVARIAFRA